MDPVTALAQLGGTATARELYAVTTRRALRTALAAGRVVRLRRDVYGLADLDTSVARALAAGGVLGGLSAAVAQGWPVKRAPDLPCVVLPRNRRSPGAGLQVRRAALADDEVEGGVTTPERTAADCARWLPDDEALTVVDSALRDGVVRFRLLRAVDRLPRTGRERARRVVLRGDHRAANPFESVARALGDGVPGLHLRPQVRIDPIGRVDLADCRLRVVVECDSWAHHASPEELRRDVRRYTALVRAGWTVVRFTWREVMHEPDYVRAVLADVTAAASRKAVRAGPPPRAA